MMDFTVLLTILFGFTCCVTSVLVITRRDPMISALFLVLNFASLAGLYLMLFAQFIAVVQIIVYAGAIMVLVLFVIMLLRPEQEKKFFELNPKMKLFTIVIGVVVFVQFVFTIFSGMTKSVLPAAKGDGLVIGTVEAIGTELFTKYLLPFESIAFLLLAATIGALVLAKKKLD